MTSKQEKKERVTVDYLAKYMSNVAEKGFGDFEIKIGKEYLHEDEFFFASKPKELQLRGSMIYEKNYMACSNLLHDIERAFEKFRRSVVFSDE